MIVTESKSLVYLSYGSGPHVLEVMFSIVSARLFLHPCVNDIKVIVFTDTPEKYVNLDVEIDSLDENILSQWLGNETYVHRRKLMCVREALRKRGGSVVFVDSDTYFVQTPEKLFDYVKPGFCCLHLLENKISDKIGKPTQPLSNVIRENSFYNLAGNKIKISPTEAMWNSGVIGVHAFDALLIDEAINLTDALWRQIKSVMTIEQFAVSVTFKQLKVKETANVVVHYWPPEIRRAFQKQLNLILQSYKLREMNLPELYRHRPRPTPTSRLKRRLKSTIVALRIPLSVFRTSFG